MAGLVQDAWLRGEHVGLELVLHGVHDVDIDGVLVIGNPAQVLFPVKDVR